MDFYFGVDLLHHLQKHYEPRLSLALSKSFNQADSRYFWLFKELECRVTTLRKILVMISALPGFMCRQTEEQVFAMVVSSTSSWFSVDVLGDQPKDAAGNCSYYQESNPYWVDYQLAVDRFTPDYDYTNLAAFYVDLVEYLVMAVRLYFFMPKIEQDTEFTPDRLQSALQDNDRTEWVFSRLEEQWKQKYYAVAVSPPEHGIGNLCPISFGKYKGKYSARWIDCAHCHFNVAQPPCCLCVAGAGIQKKEDFKRDLQDRLFDIDKIRRTNEEEIRLREERERSFERRSVYPRPTPYAARPVVPAGPTQEKLDAEYIRICQSYDPTSEEWTVDRYNRRWIMCTVCGRIKQDVQMSYYGGKGGANRGVCADCSRNGRS